MTRILISGATGFIGSHLLKLAVSSGAGEVHAVSSHAAAPTKAVFWHQADLSSAKPAAELIERIRPTHVIHAAWIATPGIYLQSPQNLDWLTASIAMIRAFGQAGGIRWVGLGTSAEYAPDATLCVEERTPLVPASIYGKCKLACGQAMLAAAQIGGFSAAWGRIFLPYGPGDWASRLIPSLLAALQTRQRIPTTEGRQKRDFVLSTDVADMLFRFLWIEDSGAFNIGTGIATPVRTVMETLAGQFDASHLLEFGARPIAPGEPACLVADMTKTFQALGHIQSTTLADGLQQTIQQFLSGRK